MVLAELISEYLKSNRRLVVPELGAFLVKEPDHKVLFSSLVKRDDGVLRELLLSSGLSDMEVEVLINRLLFEVRYAIENSEEYILVGVGSFKGDSSGALQFTEWSQVEMSIAEQEQSFESSEDVEPSVDAIVEKPIVEPVVELEPEIAPEIAQEEQCAESEIVVEPKAPVKRPVSKRRSSLDVWLIVAIAAAVVALGSILYGFVLERSQGGSLFESASYTLTDDSVN